MIINYPYGNLPLKDIEHQIELLELVYSDRDIKEREISCLGLSHIIDSCEELRRNFALIKYDLELVKRDIQIVFALDFSEIFTYLWPEKSEANIHNIVKLLLESQKALFTIPPGTSVELLNHTRYLETYNIGVYREIRRLSNNPMFLALSDSFFRQPSKTTVSTFIENSGVIKSLFSEFSKQSDFFSRFNYLSEMKNIIDFKEIIAGEDPNLGPEKEVFEEALSYFNIVRGKFIYSNIIDSHNFALIWQLSKTHFSKKDRVYYLVTSSGIPYTYFRGRLFGDFPNRGISPAHPQVPLVRHPIHALYFVKLLEQDKIVQKKFSSMYKDLVSLLEIWRNLPRYRAFLRGEIKSNEFIHLPRNEQYLKKYFNFVGTYELTFSAVKNAIESDIINQDNLQLSKGLERWEISEIEEREQGRITHEETKDNVPVVTAILKKGLKTVIDLFEKLNKITIRHLIKYRERIKDIPENLLAEVDIEGAILNKEQLEVKIRKNRVFGNTEVTSIYKATNESYLFGDIFNDCFAIWWRAKVPFSDFITEVLRFTKKTYDAFEEDDFDDLLRKCSKKVDNKPEGIHIYLSSRKVKKLELDLISSLERDEYLKKIVNTDLIMNIRIATKLGDFIYDFGRGPSLKKPPSYQAYQKIGIISHLPLPEPISWLLYNTNQRRAKISETERVVGIILEKYRKEQVLF
jgi:hypothetical protein